MVHIIRLCLGVVAVLLCSCGSRVDGHPDGEPVGISVVLERGFTSAFERSIETVDFDEGSARGATSPHGLGTGLRFSTTEVAVLGGTRERAHDLFELRPSWGRERWVVAVRPNTTVYLTVDVFGGRRGRAVLEPRVVGGNAPSEWLLRLDSTGASFEPIPAAVPGIGVGEEQGERP